jgi:glycosyltransferase involved in cell wall biosynthesis
VVVVQDGSRLRYAVPVGLQRRGALERVYADWYAWGSPVERFMATAAEWLRPGAGQRLLERRHPELERRKVFRSAELVVKLARGRKRFGTSEEHWAWCAEQTAAWILRHGFGEGNALHGFVRNLSPGLVATARAKGLAVVADQMIAPMHEERRQLRTQIERFPGWEADSGGRDEDLVEAIEVRTWTAVHHITCASKYVRDALLESGVGAEKITVLPYPVESVAPGRSDVQAAGLRSGRPVVGFVGSVGLRKGVPYLLEVARRLPGVAFELAGPMLIDPNRLSGAGNVKWIGVLPRSEIAAKLAGWDVFFLPSTCEGSAVAVMEAMAAGLPVVTSPNSGSVIDDGVEGFIRDYDAVDELAGVIERLVQAPTLRTEMGQAGKARVQQLTVDRYAEGLCRLFDEVRAKH